MKRTDNKKCKMLFKDWFDMKIMSEIRSIIWVSSGHHNVTKVSLTKQVPGIFKDKTKNVKLISYLI